MRCTVLYVDDEPINLELFEINLSKHYIVKTALSGPEGLKVLKGINDIKIVVSDMRMPQMTGLEFIDLAKALKPEIDYYILTGFDITPEIYEALRQKRNKGNDY